MRKTTRNRILSAVLALAAVVSLLPMISLPAQTVSESDQPQQETVLPPAPELTYDYDTLKITLDGEETYSLSLPEHEKVTIKAEGLQEEASYQWQILNPEKEDQWVNIYDATEATLSLSAALLKNMLSADGTAQVRCRAYTDDYAYLTPSFTATLVQEVTVESETYYAPVNPIKMAEGDPAPEFVTVQIQYIQYGYVQQDDGSLIEDELGQAFTPYIATLKSGTDLVTFVANPTIVGFTPVLTKVTIDGVSRAPSAEELGDNSGVNINLTDITADIVYTVEYHPSTVQYEVHYFFQNIYDDLYVEDAADEEKKPIYTTGYTGTRPDPSYTQKAFPGFTSLYYEPETIAADGSTVFQVYYERNYYLMEFDCNGGYGTDTIYVRYGTYISVPLPTRMGYTFLGWDLVGDADPNGDEGAAGVNTLPETMPAYNSAYIALWKTIDTTYTIVYWAENANDPYYSFWGDKKIENIESASELKPLEVADAHPANTADGITDAAYFTLNGKKTLAGNPETVTVSGDGSTVINLYYTRNEYTLTFIATGKCAMTEHTHITDITAENSCYAYTCGEAEHVHTATCLSCTKEEHTHSSSCCIVVEHTHNSSPGICCNIPEHPVHSAENGCSLLCSHNCDAYCYGATTSSSPSNTELSYFNELSLDSGYIYRFDNNATLGESYDRYYLYFDGSWYSASPVSGEPVSSGTVGTSLSNWNEDYYYKYSSVHNCTHNTHSSSCYTCSKMLHTHGDNCNFAACTYGYEHKHDKGDCQCTSLAHTHTEECYGNCTHETTHTHTDVCKSLVCTQTEHKHTTTCDSSSGSKIVYEITGKYGQDIRKHFPIKSDEDSSIDYTGYWWEVPDGSSFFEEGMNIVGIDTIPGENINSFTGEYKGKNAEIYYYLETLNDESDPTDDDYLQYKNEWYKLYKTVITVDSGYLTEKEEFHNITGFTKGAYTPNGIFSSSGGVQPKNYLYYTRNSYNINYYNHNEYYGAPKSVEYETPLNTVEYNIGEPSYPEGLEPGAYEFKGWYTTAGRYPGTEVDWENITMPANDLTLYAKWEPVQRNVYFYYLYTDIEDKDYWYTTDLDGNQVPSSYPIVVEHGALLGTTYNYIPTREGYDFVGWFYMDEDNKKKFAPDTMEIKRDLHLFAEWQSDIDTTYEVTYVLEGTTTPVADPTAGHSSAGKTKTFNAKAGVELLPEYQSKPLFPVTNSHSILMEEQDTGKTKNKFAFEYVEDEVVYYKVKYLNKIDNSVLHKEQIIPSTNAIVTEKFIPIEGYLPEKYYIRKVLAADYDEGSETNVIPENEIIFYYNPDTTHGLYTIEYYKEAADGSGYELAQSVVAHADLTDADGNPTIITAEILNFSGFVHAESLDQVITYAKQADGSYKKNDPVPGHSGTLSAGGLEIKVYYNRIEYNYTVQYVEYGTTNVLHTEQSSAKFGSTVEHSAPNTYEYNQLTYIFYPTEEKPQTQNMEIRASNSANIMTFYYEVKKTHIFYQAICTVPDLEDFGVVSLNHESSASANNLSGSVATVGKGFRFDGWFDENGNQITASNWLTTESDGSIKLKPTSFLDEDSDGIIRYYARFSPITSSMTINKQFQDGKGDAKDNFLFSIKGQGKNSYIDLTVVITGNGSAVIDNLPIGDYTVTELTAWSWEYSTNDIVVSGIEAGKYALDISNASISFTAVEQDSGNSKNQITFANTYQESDWLSSESDVADNDFGIPATP